MAFNILFVTLGCLTALNISGLVNAYPQFQQTWQQQQLQQQPRYEPVSEVCLGCICESISSCDRNLTCEGDVCGMFRITWAYWADSGKPVLQGDNPSDGLAYARCTNDATCARQAVVNYLTRFAQDCNRDGAIDCLDYASIHKLGGYGCSAPLDPVYKNKYDTCQKSIYQLSGSVEQQQQLQQQPQLQQQQQLQLQQQPQLQQQQQQQPQLQQQQQPQLQQQQKLQLQQQQKLQLQQQQQLELQQQQLQLQQQQLQLQQQQQEQLQQEPEQQNSNIIFQNPTVPSVE